MVDEKTKAYRFARHKNKPADYRRAKDLRQNSTDGEEVLWGILRSMAKETGFKFRRQYPIHPYIADFVCLKLRLIIEIDGISHDTRLEKDKRRDAQLNKMGYEVLRFINREVIENQEGVASAILNRSNEILNGNHQPLP
ncbi:MAG: DUF559 domain-containing protein [Bdellovibrionales bacterium]